MPRLARKNLNTSFFHMMVQGVNKEFIFNEEEDIKKYLKLIKDKKEEHEFNILAYCMMNNHAHFLIYTEDIQSFGKFMKKVNQNYADYYNKKNNRCGVLFRNRYLTEPIYDMRYLITCIKYIHENPVKAKMVEKCEDYKYSTYKHYIENTGPTQTEIMKKIFGEKFNYSEAFKEAEEIRYIDVEKETEEEAMKYITKAIKQYKKETKIQTYEILSDATVLANLIKYLKEKYKIKYIETAKYLEINKTQMYHIKNSSC